MARALAGAQLATTAEDQDRLEDGVSRVTPGLDLARMDAWTAQ